MYKPNFCSDCGSSIERTRWHFWTSRQFCADCARRFRRAQFVAPLMAGIALFVLGLVAGRAATIDDQVPISVPDTGINGEADIPKTLALR